MQSRTVARASLLVAVAGVGLAGWAVGVPIVVVAGGAALGVSLAIRLTRPSPPTKPPS